MPQMGCQAFSWKLIRYRLDPLLMLGRICGVDGIHLSAGSSWKTMESRIKLKIFTGAEATALEALKNLRPRIFHVEHPAIMYLQITLRLSKLLKQTDWKSGGGGVREYDEHPSFIHHTRHESRIWRQVTPCASSFDCILKPHFDGHIRNPTFGCRGGRYL